MNLRLILMQGLTEDIMEDASLYDRFSFFIR